MTPEALIAVRLDDALDPEVLAVAITAAEGLGRTSARRLNSLHLGREAVWMQQNAVLS